jgi:hypothetical protein
VTEAKVLSADSQEHPNGLTRVKILEATGEGADLAVAEKNSTGTKNTIKRLALPPSNLCLLCNLWFQIRSAKLSCQSSSPRPKNAPRLVAPALLTAISIPPNCATAASTRRWGALISRRSAGQATPWLPDPISCLLLRGRFNQNL